VLAKNSLIKNIFEEEKKFDSETRFYSENSKQAGWPHFFIAVFSMFISFKKSLKVEQFQGNYPELQLLKKENSLNRNNT